MSTTLKNKYLKIFDEKLKIYSSIFFKTVDINDTLLPELKNITKDANNLNIPIVDGNIYNTTQFNDFIRNIVNFKIKNSDALQSTNTNMDFIKKVVDANNNSTFSFNDNVKNNIVETLKVINVFVDILEAYKICIENEQDTTSLSGYSNDITINQIELVSETTRIYARTTMYPSISISNAGYIRNVIQSPGNSINILYLSIQSFNKDSYSDIFNKTCITTPASCDSITNSDIFTDASLTDKNTITGLVLKSSPNYKRQIYNRDTTIPSQANISLNDRNKALIVILLKTLFDLDPNFRKQSVYALYFYYKFVQLYSCLIINVSNVMYADINTPNINCINIYNTTKSEYVSEIKVTTEGTGYSRESNDNVAISFNGGSASFRKETGTTIPTSTTVTIDNNVRSEITIIPTAFTMTPSLTSTGGNSVVFTAKSYPIVVSNTVSHTANIDRLVTVINNIDISLSDLISNMSKYSQNNDDNSFEFTTSSTPATISLSSENKVIITITNTTKYNMLNKYDFSYDLINDYIVYDNKNKKYYNILTITDSNSANPPSFNIEINAVLDETALTKARQNDKSTELFKNASGETVLDGATIPNTTGIFLDIRKKDINVFKNGYIDDRKSINNLNEIIGFNTNKVQRQKNLYESQYNKNVFLTRQILIYNIIISIIILILISINLMNVDKELAKTISLACFGIIILLFVIYITSNITYLETFTGSDTNTDEKVSILHRLTYTYYRKNKLSNDEYNNNKIEILNKQIDDLNKKFISYFEKIIITIPSADSVDFYREIKNITSTEIENKNYVNKLLEFNKSQGNNDMDTIKYELENNKLYILTLLISSIIFIGFYNMYINYKINEKYLSLILFICIIIFIIISAYYIINSNKRVRTVYKHKYWGPETSKNF
jgi:hypothetical protein